MKLIENHVRLMRRSLVASLFEKPQVSWEVATYLRDVCELNMVLPSEQTDEQRERYLNRLEENEKWLARKYGCILLPDYHDCIFLNSKWANPYTLYVRLNAPVPELGALGEIYWMPEDTKVDLRELAEKNHKVYVDAFTPEKPQSLWRKLSDGLAHLLR